MTRSRTPLFLCLLTLSLLLGTAVGAAAADSTYLGKNPGKIKGRWLEVKDRAALQAASGYYLGEMAVDIQWKKEENEAPMEEDILAENLHDQLLDRLRTSHALGEFHSEPPAEGAAGVVRIDCDLVVEPGSRAARYVVGFGAGKSKSILEIHLRDHSSGETLALYHGYGTGSGMGFKLAGGGARKMTQDDIQENTKLLVELLAEVR